MIISVPLINCMDISHIFPCFVMNNNYFMIITCTRRHLKVEWQLPVYIFVGVSLTPQSCCFLFNPCCFSTLTVSISLLLPSFVTWSINSRACSTSPNIVYCCLACFLHVDVINAHNVTGILSRLAPCIAFKKHNWQTHANLRDWTLQLNAVCSLTILAYLHSTG